MSKCTWDPSKHGGQQCPVHGAGSSDKNHKVSMEKGKYYVQIGDGEKEEISREEFDELREGGYSDFDENEDKDFEDEFDEVRDIDEDVAPVGSSFKNKRKLTEEEFNNFMKNHEWDYEFYEDKENLDGEEQELTVIYDNGKHIGTYNKTTGEFFNDEDYDEFYSRDDIMRRHKKIEDSFNMPEEQGWKQVQSGEKCFIKNEGKNNEMFIQYNGAGYDGSDQEWVAGYMKDGEYTTKKFTNMEEAKDFIENNDSEKLGEDSNKPINEKNYIDSFSKVIEEAPLHSLSGFEKNLSYDLMSKIISEDTANKVKEKIENRKKQLLGDVELTDDDYAEALRRTFSEEMREKFSKEELLEASKGFREQAAKNPVFKKMILKLLGK